MSFQSARNTPDNEHAIFGRFTPSFITLSSLPNGSSFLYLFIPVRIQTGRETELARFKTRKASVQPYDSTGTNDATPDHMALTVADCNVILGRL